MLKKTAFFSILLLLNAALSVAQSSVEGTVIDRSTRLPVTQATVEFGDGRPVITDDRGDFHSGRLKDGVAAVRVTAIGYRAYSGTLHSGEKSVIELAPSNQLMQPIEIRAVRASEKAPFTHSTIGSSELSRVNQGQDLPFLLNQLPSVIVNSDAGNGVGYTGIRVRGTDATRINVTLNGIPYNDAESQSVYFVDLPDFASSVSSVQLQRGVGTSSNGAGAFGATINMGTNDVKEKAYLQLNNSYGSYNSWKNTFWAGTGLLNKHFTFDARLSRISSDGYIDRAKSNLRSGYLSGAYINEKNSLRLNVFSGHEKTYQAWYGVPQEMMSINRRYNPAGMEKPGLPYDNQTDNYTQTHAQLFYNHKFSSRLALNAAAFYTHGKGYYEEYKAEQAFTDYGMTDPVIDGDTVSTTDLVRQLWLDNHYYGTIFSLQYKDKGDDLIFGGGWNRYKGNHYGEVIWTGKGAISGQPYYRLDALKSDLNLYGKWLHQLAPQWSSFADLQYRKVDYAINGFKDNPGLRINNHWNFVNPKAGITYSHKDWQAYFSYALAQKEPNRDDFEAGKEQQPVPETLHDFELGIERRKVDWSWGVTAFYMKYRNQLVLTGKINDIGAYTRSNIPNSYRTGVEISGRLKASRWFQAQGNLSFSANRIIGFMEYLDDYDNGGQKRTTYGKTDIALSPGVIGNASLVFIPAHGLEIALISKFVSRQYLDNTSKESRSLAPYFTEDVRLIYTFPQRLVKQALVMFQLNNLFNAKYSPSGYTYSYYYGNQLVTSNNYYPMAERNVMLSLNIDF
jgi:iron complex outermembrane receptor protein